MKTRYVQGEVYMTVYQRHWSLFSTYWRYTNKIIIIIIIIIIITLNEWKKRLST